MSTTKLTVGILAIAAVIAAIIVNFSGTFALGNITSTSPSQVNNTEFYKFFASSTDATSFSTTTSAVSTSIDQWIDSNGRIDKGYFVISGAKDVKLYFQRGDTSGVGNTGSTTYSVQVSPDGTDWYAYNRLQNSTSTIADADGEYVTVGSYIIEAATSTVPFTMTDLGWYAVRCHVTEATDGEHSCSARAEF